MAPVLAVCTLVVLCVDKVAKSFAASETIELEDTVSVELRNKLSMLTPFSMGPGVANGKSKWEMGLHMAPCTSDEDCDAAFRMICKSGHCVCKPGDLFFELPKYGCFSKVHMFGPCEVSGQCIAMNINTYCNPDNSRCTCSPNYFFNGRECVLRYDGSSLKAQEIYKAAVVAAACFIVAVVGIFVACIVRRSFCRREQNLPQNDSNRNSDIFSISDEIAALRAVDKPPSYEEVLQIERTFYGIPPPEYSAPRSASAAAYPVPLGYASEQVNYLNLPYPLEDPPMVQNQATGITVDANIECHKESDESAHEEATISSPSVVPSTSQFIAAAEVLSPPSLQSDVVGPSPSTSLGSRNRRDRLFSSINIQKSTFKRPANACSSLPCTPVLSTHSRGVTSNRSSDFRKEQLKSDCQSISSNLSIHCTPDSQGNNPSSSVTQESDSSSGVASSRENTAPTLAYDNLAFVSDLHI